MTYTDGGILIQLVFCRDAKACAVATSSPGQVDCRLQLVVHLLVDGASELGTIIAMERVGDVNTRNDESNFSRKRGSLSDRSRR